MPATTEQIAALVASGDVRSAARLMRDIDDGRASATDVLKALFPKTGRAYVVGITGAPGAGKSTLTDRLIAFWRAQGKTVGVVCVDPTSPFSGGAILGDRIRMQGHATDEGVFIRSLATRGALGGLSRATGEVIRVMDAMGKDVVIVETVGVGQDEVDIAKTAHTTVVVVVPGMGDDIQAIKAGILEVADVFAVNKADREGADRTVRELRAMLELRHITAPMEHDADHKMTKSAAFRAPEHDWEIPIVKTVAARDEGIAELAAALERHREYLVKEGQLLRREAQRARQEFVELLRERLVRHALSKLEAEQGALDGVAERIARREADPYTLAEQLSDRLVR
ncbi:MAG: methylmalonyl Co-A mutase-associated GTPase MeaB [Deltaproteobacteria bacterium]|nr:methylmalonyl Co-A mutase-associated GTPase MeaB [Deltaproteobacteria bacterium]